MPAKNYVKKTICNSFYVFFTFFLLLAFCSAASAYPPAQNEKFAIRALRTIHAAQTTYAATTGNGNYGTFQNLEQRGLIDSVLARGFKYGYILQMLTLNQSGTTPAKFSVSARPSSYRKTGRKSFYIDESGLLRGADKNGAAATVTDFIIDTDCVPYEECAMSSLRTLHSAEVTYAATVGNGNYGNFIQLRDANLISPVLAVGCRAGYCFQVMFTGATVGTPASFKLTATPIQYGGATRRSFYMGMDGVLRGADKNGAPANENDPPIQE